MSNTKFKSPFATSFKNACKRGTPFCTVVENIAKRTGKNPTTVWNSLYKAGVVRRQKFNGQWIYFPCEWEGKATATMKNKCQYNLWQCFVEWCVVSGNCDPEKLWNNCGSQADFEQFCRKFWNKQYAGPVASNNAGRKRPSVTRSNRNTSTSRGRKTTTSRKTNTKPKTYTLSGSRRSSSSRRAA